MAKKYNIIYADPPWAYRNMGNIQATAQAQYNTMNNEDICNLPVQKICEDNCILFLWATFPKIQEALDVIKAWGFEYKTCAFTWMKMNRNGTPFFGMGQWTRSNAEICLLATKGKDAHKLVKNHKVRAFIESQRKKHSEKPNEVRKRIVELVGNVPRIELFARQKTEGWDVWGNEVDSDIKIEDSPKL